MHVTLAPVRWAPQPLAQLLVSQRPASDAELVVDPRPLLAGAGGWLGDLGLGPVMAVEMEFYLFEPGFEGDGPPILAGLPHGNAPATTNANSPDELVARGGFLGEVDAFCRAQDIPASVVSSEMAAGQYEINLHHV